MCVGVVPTRNEAGIRSCCRTSRRASNTRSRAWRPAWCDPSLIMIECQDALPEHFGDKINVNPFTSTVHSTVLDLVQSMGGSRVASRWVPLGGGRAPTRSLRQNSRILEFHVCFLAHRARVIAGTTAKHALGIRLPLDPRRALVDEVVELLRGGRARLCERETAA